MIGAGYVLMNVRAGHAWPQIGRDKEVVQPPADVAFASGRMVRPPTVSSLALRIHLPVRVDVASLDHLIQPDALFGQEAGGLLILARPSQIESLDGPY